MSNNAFEGWTKWDVGCHWSRLLPDGRKVTMSTWQNGDGSRGGYVLVLNYRRTYFDDLATAKSAFAQLAEGRITDLAEAPGGSDTW